VLVTPVIRLPQQWYAQGVKVVTYSVERFLPTAKSINYLTAMLALDKARARQAVEAVYVDPAGSILEGTTSNLFLFKSDCLITPSDRVLAGITRQIVLEIARKHWEVLVRPVRMAELLGADEVFLSSSVKEVLPVVRVDEARIGGAVPGERTRRLITLFDEFVRDYSG
jgi:branched-chain amino acid aminotransferase